MNKFYLRQKLSLYSTCISRLKANFFFFYPCPRHIPSLLITGEPRAAASHFRKKCHAQNITNDKTLTSSNQASTGSPPDSDRRQQPTVLLKPLRVPLAIVSRKKRVHSPQSDETDKNAPEACHKYCLDGLWPCT